MLTMDGAPCLLAMCPVPLFLPHFVVRSARSIRGNKEKKNQEHDPNSRRMLEGHHSAERK